MARASWKYHFFKDTEVEAYIDYLTDVTPNYINEKRKTTLTKLNYFLPSILYTGKYQIERRFNKYHMGFKLGQFTKNRKPFYFRSKKKKNVTKKYHLSIATTFITTSV